MERTFPEIVAVAQSVRERTAQWAREAKKAELGDRLSVTSYLLLAGAMFMSATAKELGWGYLLMAGLLMWLAWWRLPRKKRPN